MKQNYFVLAAAAILTAGCNTAPTAKTTLERGWIGGEYRLAAQKLLPKGEGGRVYVEQVYEGTPAEEAGLKPGDLILALNGQSIASLKEFHHAVDTAPAGSHALMRVYRDGQALELPVTVGRETYQQWHAMQIGLRWSAHVDLWPNPEFSFLPVANYRHPEDRVELRSPKMLLAKQADRSRNKKKNSVYSDEGWDAWFVLGGCNAYKQILKQEAVPPAAPEK
jgi:hypothetical protein